MNILTGYLTHYIIDVNSILNNCLCHVPVQYKTRVTAHNTNTDISSICKIKSKIYRLICGGAYNYMLLFILFIFIPIFTVFSIKIPYLGHTMRYYKRF